MSTNISLEFTHDFSVMTSPPSDGTVASRQSTLDSYVATGDKSSTNIGWSNDYNTSTKVLGLVLSFTDTQTADWAAEAFDELAYFILESDLKHGDHDYQMYYGEESGEAE